MKFILRTVILTALFLPWKAFPQRLVTLKECYEQASAISSLTAEKETYRSIWQLRDQNLSKGWLPTLDANGSFNYNSSVVDMTDVLGALPIPGISEKIKPLPHEQYKITVDVNQVFYDGGAIKSARSLEKADLEVNQKQVESDLYKLRAQVNNYYFNILLADRQKALLLNYLDVISKRIASMKSALGNGLLLPSDLDVITAEKIKTEQQVSENDIRKASLLKILSELTGIPMDPGTALALPAGEAPLSHEITRPELQVFDLRKSQLSTSLDILQSKRMPRAFGFASLGFGNPPGSNFFKDEFAPYYIIGAGVKWNIFDWKKVQNERQLVSLQQNIIDSRKTDLADNLERMLEAKSAEIASFESMLKTDGELIELRKRITASAESQFENGMLTATELLAEMNAEKQARINFEIHTIQLAMAKIDFMNISGKEIQ